MMPNARGSRLVDKHCPLHPAVEMVEHVIATDPPQYRYVCPVCTHERQKDQMDKGEARRF